MWTRLCIQMALFIIVVGTAWTQELDSELEWIPLDNGTPIPYVTALAGSEHRLYAATLGGILFSENGGSTWFLTAFDNEDKFITTLTTDGNTVYAGTWYYGVFRSDDAGLTWKPINDGLRFHELGGEHFYGEVRRILIIDNTLISVMYHGGTYTSTDRGETWHDISEEWFVGDSIYSMTVFNGYLWSAISIGSMARSPDNGQSWQQIPPFQHDRTNDWAVLNGQLYVAAQAGVGRWNKTLQTWEYPMDGLPIGQPQYPNAPPYVSSFAVQGGRLFAGLHTYGVYVFDSQSETWLPADLQGVSVFFSFIARGFSLRRHRRKRHLSC